MSLDARCSAIPSELISYARAADDIARALRNELHIFDAVIQWSLLRTSNAVRALGFEDPLWDTAAAIDVGVVDGPRRMVVRRRRWVRRPQGRGGRDRGGPHY
jgi:hypothetical protein